MATLYERVQEATRTIQKIYREKPAVGIILGTGLGGLTEDIRGETEINYDDIPHLPHSAGTFHAGKLVCGKLSGKNVVAMEGRFHYYEGFTLEEVTIPVRVMKALGAEILIVSNACGGMNPMFDKGDIMIIEDHVNLMGINPLIGPNDDRLGPRFPDMCQPYDKKLIALAQQVALEEGIKAQKGVYVAVTGPNLETRAEYRFLRTIGADAVGMSTVPEVIVAIHSGLKVLGLSIVTDMCLPDALEPADIEQIIAVANEAEPKLRTIVKKVIEGI